MISGPELLSREAEARRLGSGITPEAITGEWWLQQLWSREGQEQAAAASLLRSLSACLAITPVPVADGSAGLELRNLELRNSVRLGLLELRFTGPGRLSGRRPLLRFHFERMQLLWAGKPFWQASLPPPSAAKEPFFALIATQPGNGAERARQHSEGEAGGWLAARGRGGGLALWTLRPA
jgi:hypothetical protein